MSASDLPEDIWAEIFQDLPISDLLSTACVDKRWNKIVTTDDSVWLMHRNAENGSVGTETRVWGSDVNVIANLKVMRNSEQPAKTTKRKIGKSAAFSRLERLFNIWYKISLVFSAVLFLAITPVMFSALACIAKPDKRAPFDAFEYFIFTFVYSLNPQQLHLVVVTSSDKKMFHVLTRTNLGVFLYSLFGLLLTIFSRTLFSSAFLSTILLVTALNITQKFRLFTRTRDQVGEFFFQNFDQKEYVKVCSMAVILVILPVACSVYIFVTYEFTHAVQLCTGCMNLLATFGISESNSPVLRVSTAILLNSAAQGLNNDISWSRLLAWLVPALAFLALRQRLSFWSAWPVLTAITALTWFISPWEVVFLTTLFFVASLTFRNLTFVQWSNLSWRLKSTPPTPKLLSRHFSSAYNLVRAYCLIDKAKQTESEPTTIVMPQSIRGDKDPYVFPDRLAGFVGDCLVFNSRNDEFVSLYHPDHGNVVVDKKPNEVKIKVGADVIVTVGNDYIRVYDFKGTLLQKISVLYWGLDDFTHTALSEMATYLIVELANGGVRKVTLSTGEHITSAGAVIHTQPKHSVRQVAVSEKGQAIIFNSVDSTIVCLHADMQSALWTVGTETCFPDPQIQVSDGFVVVMSLHQFTIYCEQTGDVLWQFDSHTVTRIPFPMRCSIPQFISGNHCFLRTSDHSIEVLSLKHMEHVHTMKFDQKIGNVRCSPSRLAVQLQSGITQIWDFSTDVGFD